MHLTDATSSRLIIGRLRAHYLVPRDHPDPAKVHSRLDDAANDLARVLPAVVAAALPASDASVWVIRTLHLELDADASRPRDVAARQWAAQITRVLNATL